MFIDTHCHLDLIIENDHTSKNSPKNIEKIQAILDESCEYRVTSVITIGTNIDSSKLSVQFANLFPSVYATIGVHPCDTQNPLKSEINALQKIITQDTSKKIVGIGEIGLDFYHPGFDVSIQNEFFRAQIELAISQNLPISIHSRNAFKETIAILDEYKASNLTGVFHCFSEDKNAAKNVIDRGFLIGVDGHISYPKNQYLRDAIAYAGIENILLETDAPFLAPQKIRGSKNHPKNIALIADFIQKEIFPSASPQTLAKQITDNTAQLFPLEPHIKNQ